MSNINGFELFVCFSLLLDSLFCIVEVLQLILDLILYRLALTYMFID